MPGMYPQPPDPCHSVFVEHRMTQNLPCIPCRGGLSIYASTEETPGAKELLIHMLLQSLARLDPAWRTLPSEEVMLHKSPLGKPALFLKQEPGPALSFSYGAGRLWAAMCTRGVVGIDVAYPSEFFGDYPFARAFRPEELEWSRILCSYDRPRGAALLWSIKEASVKASGTGFHLRDPLEVRVGLPRPTPQGVFFEAMADRPVSVCARMEGRGWLSVASAGEDKE